MDIKLQTLEETVASSSGSFGGSSSVLDGLQQFGVVVAQGITRFKDVVLNNLTAHTITATNGMQFVDESSGATYCVRINNGDWHKFPGTCDSIPMANIAPQTITPPSPAVSTTTPVSASSTSAGEESTSSGMTLPAAPVDTSTTSAGDITATSTNASSTTS